MQKNNSLARRFWGITLPIAIQNGITNFVSLLDNIMVGSVGTLQMSGVSIVNQLLFVFNLCVYGGSAGAGIFTAQFYGSGDQKNIRHTFRFKLLLCLALGGLGIGAFLLWGRPLIGLYLQGQGDPAEALLTLDYGSNYLQIILWGLVPFALTNAYAGTLRECGQSIVPMVAGIVAVFVNLLGNCILIYGLLGAPALGVQGAAIATVISRYVELAIVALWAHCNTGRLPFMKGLYRSAYIPGRLLGQIVLKGSPLLFNEALFAVAEAFLNQTYSTRGLEVVPAMNIATTIFNLLNVVVLAMAHSVGIFMGQMMGAGSPRQEIRRTCNRLIRMCLVAGLIFCLLLWLLSGVFPLLYNTTDSVQQLSSVMICILGVYLITLSYINPIYFSLRAGGSTWSTFFFDCGFSWLCMIPVALALCYFTQLPIVPLYALCQGTAFIKCILGWFMLKNDGWIRNLAHK